MRNLMIENRVKPEPYKGKRARRLRRRLFVFALILALLIAIFFMSSGNTLDAAANDNIADQLGDSIQESLDKIDFGDLNEISKQLGDNDFNLFKSDSFAAKVGKILSGEYVNDYPNIFAALFGLVGGVVLDMMPLIILIIAIAILCGFMSSLKPETSSAGVRDVIHFVAYAAVITLVLYAVADLTASTGAVLSSMKKQMDVVFPILLTLMAAIGSTASVGVYQPAVVILSSGVMQIFSAVVMPLFIITLVFSIVGNLSASARFDKFVSFFTSVYKWIIGITFTVFLAFLTIQGITAGAHDGVSIRAAKLTISSYVPYLGGYISQGFDLVMASSMLIKNAVGVSGMYLLFGVVLTPVLKIVIFTLGLKLAAAVTQPVADTRISNFLTSVNKAFSMLIACIIGAAFMYFLTIGLVICSGNIF